MHLDKNEKNTILNLLEKQELAIKESSLEHKEKKLDLILSYKESVMNPQTRTYVDLYQDVRAALIKTTPYFEFYIYLGSDLERDLETQGYHIKDINHWLAGIAIKGGLPVWKYQTDGLIIDKPKHDLYLNIYNFVKSIAQDESYKKVSINYEVMLNNISYIISKIAKNEETNPEEARIIYGEQATKKGQEDVYNSIIGLLNACQSIHEEDTIICNIFKKRKSLLKPLIKLLAKNFSETEYTNDINKDSYQELLISALTIGRSIEFIKNNL